jgi:hypothetical protein
VQNTHAVSTGHVVGFVDLATSSSRFWSKEYERNEVMVVRRGIASYHG